MTEPTAQLPTGAAADPPAPAAKRGRKKGASKKDSGPPKPLMEQVADIQELLTSGKVAVGVAEQAFLIKALPVLREFFTGEPDLDPVARLTRDLKNASLTLGAHEARFLVDAYYQQQRDRIRANHQTKTLSKNAEPHEVLAWLLGQTETLEAQVLRALDAYSSTHIAARWARSITGIGPVIAAGLLANIDIKQAPTCGHIWAFAGQDPTKKWEKKQKRPWNGSLKRLCFIIGESFTKIANRPDDPLAIYGRIYKARKLYEQRNNDQGKYADQCAVSLATKNFDPATDAWQWYSGCFPAGSCTISGSFEREARELFPETGSKDTTEKRSEWLQLRRQRYMKEMRDEPGSGIAMLPPARIQLRSQRYAVKIFLAHYHHVLWESTFNTPPPFPYVLTEAAHMAHPELAVHTHYLAPPNWPMTADTEAKRGPSTVQFQPRGTTVPPGMAA